MYKDLIQLYQIGKELGITQKEMNKLFFSKDENRRLRYKIIFSIILIGISWLLGFAIMSLMVGRTNTTDNTYPSGARYSSVRIKDFKKKLKIFIQIK